MRIPNTGTVKDALSQLALWLLSAFATVGAIILHDIHGATDRNTAELTSRWTPAFHATLTDIATKWTPGFYDQVSEAARYPAIHESYRGLYVAQNEAFHEQVRSFMGAGGRFSAADGAALDRRIRSLEQSCAALMGHPAWERSQPFYQDRTELDP